MDIKHKPATPMQPVTYQDGAFIINGEIVAVNREPRFSQDCLTMAARANAYTKMAAHLQAIESHLKRGAPAAEGHALRQQQKDLLNELGEQS